MAIYARTVMADRPDTSPLSRSRLTRACRRGELPAEILDTADREHLIYDLWFAGWTDVEIATLTSLTTYTVGRIRERLGLQAHPASTKGDA